MSEIKKLNDKQEKPLSRKELFVIELIEESIAADDNEDGLLNRKEKEERGRDVIESIKHHRYDDAALDNLIFFWDIGRPSGDAAREEQEGHRIEMQKRMEEFGI